MTFGGFFWAFDFQPIVILLINLSFKCFIFHLYALVSLVVVVDLSDLQSIDLAGTWRHDIINNVYLSDDSELINQNKNQTDIMKSLPILLVGSKLDKVYQNLSHLIFK